MEERRRVITSKAASYGAVSQPYEPHYSTKPDMERAPLLADSAYFPEGTMNAGLYPAAGVAECPTAPPPEWACLPGYEGVAGDAGKSLPPPDLGPLPGSAPAQTDWRIPFVTEETARKALLDYAKSKCCYRKTPAEEMTFRELRPYNTYRYRLETFTEARACQWVTKPFRGEPLDPPMFAPPPLPWDILVQVPLMFADDTHKMRVPHTSSVKSCAQCLGICRTVCRKCHGGGRVQCWVCSGTGHKFHDPCQRCQGCGTESCHDCHGTRYATCSACSGQGKILNFIELTVSWKNNVYEFIVEHNSDFPTDLFKKVNGEKMFTDEQPRLPPLLNFPAPSINQASHNALQQHLSHFSSSNRIVRQRHTIEWLPLTKVEYTWRGNPYDYFVYGKENKVYTDCYPQKCCCVVM